MDKKKVKINYLKCVFIFNIRKEFQLDGMCVRKLAGVVLIQQQKLLKFDVWINSTKSLDVSDIFPIIILKIKSVKKGNKIELRLIHAALPFISEITNKTQKTHTIFFKNKKTLLSLIEIPFLLQ